MTDDVQFNAVKDQRNDCNFTFRMKDAAHALKLVIRTYETNSEVLQVFAVPRNIPKTAMKIDIPFKALSLHKRVAKEVNFEEIIEQPNLNILTVTGDFAFTNMNNILSQIIQDIPEKINVDKVTYTTVSTFLGTEIYIKIEHEKCVIAGSFLSALMTIKAHLNQQSEYRNMKIKQSVRFSDEGLAEILERINPKIEENYYIETKYRILEGLDEINLEVEL